MLQSGLKWRAVGGRVIERSPGCIGRLQDDFLLGDSTQRTVRLFSLRGLIPLPTIPLFSSSFFSTPKLINFTSCNLIGEQLLWKSAATSTSQNKDLEIKAASHIWLFKCW
jgi:hypothetical protein